MRVPKVLLPAPETPAGSEILSLLEIQELTQIILRISEEKFGGWGLCSTPNTFVN